MYEYIIIIIIIPSSHSINAIGPGMNINFKLPQLQQCCRNLAQ
jgi:hypothetical protein